MTRRDRERPVGETTRRGRRGPRQDEQDRAVSVALGERVRQRRAMAGLSQQELARRIGLTFQQVQKYERGGNRISVPMLLKIAAALDTSPAALIDGLPHGSSGSAPSSEGEVLLDRDNLALMAAARQTPPTVRRALLALTRTMAERGGGPLLPTAATDDPPAAPDDPVLSVEPAVPVEPAEPVAPRRRRRRGAVWDPADIGRATRRT